MACLPGGPSSCGGTKLKRQVVEEGSETEKYGWKSLGHVSRHVLERCEINIL